MKALIGSLTALALIATPVMAAQTGSNAPATSKTTKSTKTSKTVAKQAKAEGESTATEAKEHHAAARHHHHRASRCSCASHKAKSHKASHKGAKSSKKASTETKTK